MTGNGLSFPVSDAVDGELYSAGHWAEANRVASDEVRQDRMIREVRDDTGVYHHNTSAASIV